MHDHDELTPADPADIASALAFALRVQGRGRVHKKSGSLCAVFRIRISDDAAAPTPCGPFMMTKAARSRCSTKRLATISAMSSSALTECRIIFGSVCPRQRHLSPAAGRVFAPKSSADRRRGRPPASMATKRMIVSLRPSPGCRSASSLLSQLRSTQMK